MRDGDDGSHGHGVRHRVGGKRSNACCVATRFIEGRAASRSASTGGYPRRRKRDSDIEGMPQDYLKIVASVMPKRMEVEDVGPPRRAADLSDDELAAIVAGAKLTFV